MRAYKIVKNVNGKLFSWNFNGWGIVQYTPGEWVKTLQLSRKYGYHLTVFETLEDAKIWGVDLPPSFYEIWECEIKPAPQILPPLIDNLHSGALIYFAKMMYKIRRKFCGNSPEQLGWPKGTLMAKKVKLIRKVWPKDKEVCND